MSRNLKRILSEGQLNALSWELENEVTGKRPDSVFEGLVRERAYQGRDIFPVDGYLSWEHRWYMGTGVRPKGW